MVCWVGFHWSPLASAGPAPAGASCNSAGHGFLGQWCLLNTQPRRKRTFSQASGDTASQPLNPCPHTKHLSSLGIREREVPAEGPRVDLCPRENYQPSRGKTCQVLHGAAAEPRYAHRSSPLSDRCGGGRTESIPRSAQGSVSTSTSSRDPVRASVSSTVPGLPHSQATA